VVGPAGAGGDGIGHAADQVAAGWSKNRLVVDRVALFRRKARRCLLHAQHEHLLGADKRQDRQTAVEAEKRNVACDHQFPDGVVNLRVAVGRLLGDLRAGEHVRRQGGVIAGLSVVRDGTGEGDGLATHHQRQQGHRDEKPWSEDFHRKILHVDR